MVKNTLAYVNGAFSTPLVLVNVSSPITGAEIVSLVTAALEADHAIKLASFSHITSIPAFISAGAMGLSVCVYMCARVRACVRVCVCVSLSVSAAACVCFSRKW